MWNVRLSALALLAVCVSCRGAAGQVPAEPATPRDRSAEFLRCGPNAVYAILKLYDKPANLADIISESEPIDKDGMSLAKMQKICQQHGLSMSARRLPMAELNTAPGKPFIAHTKSFTRGDAAGHYVLVMSADADGVTILDPVTGEIDRYRTNYLADFWTGYVLIPDDGPVHWLDLLLPGVTCGLALLLAWQLRCQYTRWAAGGAHPGPPGGAGAV